MGGGVLAKSDYNDGEDSRHAFPASPVLSPDDDSAVTPSSQSCASDHGKRDSKREIN